MLHLALQLLVIPAFIGASFLSAKFDNALVRILYTLLAVWVGFIFYLFLATAIYLLWPTHALAVILECAAVLVSIYGVYNANRVRIKQVNISLPNLPSSWRGRRAVWVSDIHLGHVHGQKFAEKVVENVNALAPEIIFIGGDLFDGVKVDLDKIISPLKELKAPLGVYFVTGNHEEFFEGAHERHTAAVRAAGIRVLEDEVAEVEGLQIVGFDDRHSMRPKEYKDALAKLALDRSKPIIILKHTPNLLAMSQRAGASLQISGHTHRAQMWPLNFVAWRAFKGYSYGLKKFGSMYVYTSSGVGTWGPPMRVGTASEIVLFTFS